MATCPVCGNEYTPDPYPMYDKEKRNKKIRAVAKALEGKQKKVVLRRIVQFLKQHEGATLSRMQIFRILKEK